MVVLLELTGLEAEAVTAAAATASMLVCCVSWCTVHTVRRRMMMCGSTMPGTNPYLGELALVI